MNEEQLIAAAREAALKAYAPYSNFSVGCAIESVDGAVVTGANMENACYRLGLCAEQSALTAAQHAFGRRRALVLAREQCLNLAGTIQAHQFEAPGVGALHDVALRWI